MRSRITFGNHSILFENLTQYIITHLSVVWKLLYKIIYWSVQENIVILIVTIFCVNTKEFGKLKYCCPSITPFVS